MTRQSKEGIKKCKSGKEKTPQGRVRAIKKRQKQKDDKKNKRSRKRERREQ